jgi:sugar phosphate isomerase/epimerase
MKRRTFLKLSAGAIVSGIARPSIVVARAKDPMKRIGMSSVTFRARFRQTKIQNHPPINELKLADVPEYFADRFKVHNVEFWSRHFESQSLAYLQELKKRVAQTKAILINVQIDEPYNLADSSEESRQKSVAFFKTWIDSAVALGSMSIRANTGSGTADSCIRSFREIERYAKQKGILLLVENHGGLSSDPDALIEVVKAVTSKNLEILPDYGNFPPEIRYKGLKAILPYAKHLISAKTHQFDKKGQHTDFDFDRCMRMAQASGFPGYYSAEYYDGHGKPVDYEKVTDWMIEHIKANL